MSNEGSSNSTKHPGSAAGASAGRPVTRGPEQAGRGQEETSRSSDRLEPLVREGRDRARGHVSRLSEHAKAEVRSFAAGQKDRAADRLGGVAGALKHTARRLREGHDPAVGGYVERMGEELERVSSLLRDKDIDSMADAVIGLARRQPAAFLAGATLGGFVLGRFLKSSAARQRNERGAELAAGAGPATSGRARDWEPGAGR